MGKKVIVVSAINFYEGGPLTVLQECLSYLDKNISDDYKVIAYVHRKALIKTSSIELIELPDSRNSWIKRLYYEYFYFKKQSKIIKPYLWISLHDITPNVNAKIRAVYCHNPSPFYKSTRLDLQLSKKIFLFSLFYKYLYAINIKKNDFIIVQQNWLREAFKKNYNVQKVIVSNPNYQIDSSHSKKSSVLNNKTSFFYPAFPRVFKNFEVICEAAKILERKGKDNFEVSLTLSGNENKYSKYIYDKYNNLKTVKFIGLLPREDVLQIYNEVEVLIFPSKLETWGLPISEFKTTNKPMLVADLPYAKETVGEYEKVNFFNPINSNKLATLMELTIENKIKFEGNPGKLIQEPYVDNWQDLFSLLLVNDHQTTTL